MRHLTALALTLIATVALRADEVRIKRLPEADKSRLIAKFSERLRAGDLQSGAAFAAIVQCGPRLWSAVRSDFPDRTKEPLRAVVFFDGGDRARAWGLTPVDLSTLDAGKAKAIETLQHDTGRIAIETAAFRGSQGAFGASIAKRYLVAPARVREATDAEIGYLWMLVPYDLEEPIVTIESGTVRLLVNLSADGTIDWIDVLPESL